MRYENRFAFLQPDVANELPPSPKSMFSILTRKGIVGEDFLGGIHNMAELEASIFELIDQYPENGASSERIFHLIEIWGGRTGRGIYCYQPFVWADIAPIYNGLITDFCAIDHIDDRTLVYAANSVNTFYQALHEVGYRGMGVAFITKHSRFWMHQKQPDNMLPIYDGTFSNNIMQQGSSAKMVHLLPFWRGMVEKAKLEHVSLTALERQLFRYFND